jgi:hypothetical protein
MKITAAENSWTAHRSLERLSAGVLSMFTGFLPGEPERILKGC